MRHWEAVVILAFGGAVVTAETPVIDPYGGCRPLARPVCNAAKIREPSAREPALQAAIREGLLSADHATRDQVFMYLAENTRWLDLRPYSKILEQFSETDPLHRGLWLLDDNELARSSRDERMAAYRTAIQNGLAKLHRGRPLSRESAIAFAAAEGMVELQKLAEQFSPLVEERWKKSFGFEAFPVLFQLGEGAKDPEEASRVAAGRLQAMDDEDFALKMKDDKGFRNAVLQVARYVCAIDPFSGQRNPGCADMSSIVRRQAALEDKTRKVTSDVGGVAQTSTGDEEGWLPQMRHYVPPSEVR